MLLISLLFSIYIHILISTEHTYIPGIRIQYNQNKYRHVGATKKIFLIRKKI